MSTVVAGETVEPKRKLGQVDCERVQVHAIETVTGNQTTPMVRENMCLGL